MTDILDEVRQIRKKRTRDLELSRAAIVGWLEKVSEAYSKDFKLALELPLNIVAINGLCHEMEKEGTLVSEFRQPPFDDLPGGGGMARRYYWLADREERS